MKSPCPLLLACFALAGLVSHAFAQSYSMDWHTMHGGGGASAGGAFSVHGTIGQPDAGISLTGGNFSLTGGFWSVEETTDAPLLTIRLTPTNSVVISWPSTAVGISLQQNANLNTTTWTTPSEAVTDNGTNQFIIVNPPTGSRFYRLIRP